MQAGEIELEMRPKGKLRPVISNLADEGGAYIIVCSQGSVSDKPLLERQGALRHALRDQPNADQLHTDFYDRVRLAMWANNYPGIVAWVRQSVGRPVSGWSGVFDWSVSNLDTRSSYLVDDKACLIDERSDPVRSLPILDGITELRDSLNIPGKCVRLVGMSGLGKTRLVQALFEKDLGQVEPLDLGIAIYTDYSSETDPTARDMARGLIANNQRAILVLDNCNPKTHTELAKICSQARSPVSLLSVEYDVQDQEPEKTNVFRLQAVSPELLSEWIKQTYPNISQVDRERISEFSESNFRIAAIIAETVGSTGSIGSLGSGELFERIFHQRNSPDQTLLRAAEELSLLYSIDGIDESETGELASLAKLSRLEIIEYYEALVELQRRGLVQSRGCFRAILPQAIANRLAVRALERVSANRFDSFFRRASKRIRKSVAHRLSFLHTSEAARAIVRRWLDDPAILGNLSELNEVGYDILEYAAPVVPEDVAKHLTSALENETNLAIVEHRSKSKWFRLLRLLSYEPELFDTCATLLARLVAREVKLNANGTSHDLFGELFQLHLSGTLAPPDQRRKLILELAKSQQDGWERVITVALEHLLKAHYFRGSGITSFGARSRDWGWRPATYGDIWDWYKQAIKLALSLETELPEVRSILARNIRDLWRKKAIRETIKEAAVALNEKAFWIDGWLALRGTYHYDVRQTDESERSELRELIDLVEPKRILDRARAIVLTRNGVGWDFADGVQAEDERPSDSWKRADRAAVEIGRVLMKDTEARRTLTLEALSESQSIRSFQCGEGMAAAATDLFDAWTELKECYFEIESSKRNARLLAGFIKGCADRSPDQANRILDSMIDDEMHSELVYMQSVVGLDTAGIKRLRRLIRSELVRAIDLYPLRRPALQEAPETDFLKFVEDVSKLEGGTEEAIRIMHSWISESDSDGTEKSSEMLAFGRELLEVLNYEILDMHNDYVVGELIEVCFASDRQHDSARRVCRRFASTVNSIYFPAHDRQHIISALLKVCPQEALDEFLLSSNDSGELHVFRDTFDDRSPLEKLDTAVIVGWARIDSTKRFPVLGRSLGMFHCEQQDETKVIPSSLFLRLLKEAPDKKTFLGEPYDRVHPSGWSGSLADILESRKLVLEEVASDFGSEVREWLDHAIPDLTKWIERDREMNRSREERFE